MKLQVGNTTLESGTISHGTLRTEDLENALLPILKDVSLDEWIAIRDEMAADAQDGISADESDERRRDRLHSIMDMLDAACPPFWSFGTTEGDGSDFGFWPCLDAYEQGVTDGEILQVTDSDDVPTDYEGEFAIISDHGNVSLFARYQGRLHVIWEIV